MRRISAILFASLVVLASCEKRDLSSIETRLDNLENGLGSANDRITTIEGTIAQINRDIESLSYLKSSLVINSVSGSDAAGWSITFANGKVVKVYPKDAASAVPVISVSDDGFWLVDRCDGNGPQYLRDRAGERIRAKSVPGDPGKDGVTPVLGADAEGYWIVSYDEGKTFVRLLDDKGNPVNAKVSAGDSIFSGVVSDGATVTFSLHDGTSFTCPVVEEFMCSIDVAEDVVEFQSGETKSFTVRMRGIADAIVLCPEGWRGVLDNTTLRVTAPSATKAGGSVSFDSSSCIRILATSTRGYAVISGFGVSLSIPVPEYGTYYEEWVNNGFIVIDGQRISRDDYGDGQLVNDGDEITGSGAWFVKDGATAVYYCSWSEKLKQNTLIIGNSKTSRSAMVFRGAQGNFYLSDKASVVISGMDLTVESNTQPLFMLNDAYTCPLMIIDNCHIKCNGNAFFFSNRHQKFGTMLFTGSEFRINANDSYLGTIGKVDRLLFDNCILYSKDANLYQCQTVLSADECFDVTVTNNTFINIRRNGNGMINGSVPNARKTEFAPVVSNNLRYYCAATPSGNLGVGHWTLMQDEGGTWYSWNISGIGEDYVYVNGGNSNGTVFRSLFNPSVLSTVLTSSPLSSLDYANGVFTNTTTYGAKR